MRAIKNSDELEMRRVLDTHSNLRSQLRRQDYFAASEPSPLHEAVEDGKDQLVLIMTRDFR